MEKRVKARHRFFFAVARPIVKILARKLHFKTKPVKLPKNQNYLILSNHQGYLDPAFISLTIKRPVYFVATDVLYSQKWYSHLLFYCFGPIKKRKGYIDIACVRAMYEIAKQGGSVAVFPEANRQWNDSQFYIDRAVVRLIRMIKLPVLLYNIHGGYGVQPRWGKSLRKGKHTGQVREIIPWEEVSAMTDDELYEKIVSGLKVIDSDGGELYKSKARAEYLERQLFLCPKCGSLSTLSSHGNDVVCEKCGLTATYGENLRLTSPDPDFSFEKVVDWYEFQQQYVRDYDLDNNDLYFTDDNVKLFDKTERKRVLIASGKMTLKKDSLVIGDKFFPTSDIVGASAQDGTKLTFGVDNRSYMIIGPERFNTIKYLLFFNRICAKIAEKGGDKYYGLYPDPARR
ncbi:MAG: 1-acyl-sn-glycerol-3-phosphate acyltransferase [Clostridiales bacterium]|nr:1-acyl-sn-glycerol-3-phosphate acyltransferase [Clostridiales bacterium]